MWTTLLLELSEGIKEFFEDSTITNPIAADYSTGYSERNEVALREMLNVLRDVFSEVVMQLR